MDTRIESNQYEGSVADFTDLYAEIAANTSASTRSEDLALLIASVIPIAIYDEELGSSIGRRLAKSEDPFVRLALAETLPALCNVKPVMAQLLLEHLADDEDDDVRIAIIELRKDLEGQNQAA